MRLSITRLLLLAPALALLAACQGPHKEDPPDRTVIVPGPRAAYVTVVAELDANGTPSFGVYHDTEVVRPGDTLEFRCACAPGLEFKVSEPRLVINKDAFWDELIQEDPAAAREQVNKALEWVSGRSGSPPPDQPDPSPVDFLKDFLQNFQKVIPHLPEARLFNNWKDPDFHPGDAVIGPFVVADPAQPFAATWKFTWTIRVAGELDESKWQHLDPHIEGEPSHKDF